MQQRCHWCAVFALLVCASDTVIAQDAVVQSKRMHAAIGAVFPNQRFSIRQGTEGDLNGDGVNDYAVVVVLSDDKEVRPAERLVVFAGGLDGRYKPISVSGPFCAPEKFYNLSTVKNTLVVQAVQYADSTRMESFTLQFRYNAKLADFELIGGEEDSVEYDANAGYKVSVNYLTNVVRYARHLGKTYIERSTNAEGIEKIVQYARASGKHKEATAQFDNVIRVRLQDFECTGFSAPDTGVYIDEKFKVHRSKKTP